MYLFFDVEITNSDFWKLSLSLSREKVLSRTFEGDSYSPPLLSLAVEVDELDLVLYHSKDIYHAAKK